MYASVGSTDRSWFTIIIVVRSIMIIRQEAHAIVQKTAVLATSLTYIFLRDLHKLRTRELFSNVVHWLHIELSAGLKFDKSICQRRENWKSVWTARQSKRYVAKMMSQSGAPILVLNTNTKRQFGHKVQLENINAGK